jgi:hypothetical protein
MSRKNKYNVQSNLDKYLKSKVLNGDIVPITPVQFAKVLSLLDDDYKFDFRHWKNFGLMSAISAPSLCKNLSAFLPKMGVLSKDRYSHILKINEFRDMKLCINAHPNWVPSGNINISESGIIEEMLFHTFGFSSEFYPYFVKGQWNHGPFTTQELSMPNLHPLCKYYLDDPDNFCNYMMNTMLLINPPKPIEVKSSSRMSDNILNIYNRIADGEFDENE